MFSTELIKRFESLCEVYFIRAKSYDGMHSSGEVEIHWHKVPSLQGKDVILIEDIVDSGTTLSRLLPVLQKEDPASIELATLLFKPDAVQHPLDIAWCGFEIPNRFVVGFGLDYDEVGRNYPAVYVLKE